jgi:hypothetical protein
MTRASLKASLFAFGAAASQLAWACPVCGQAKNAEVQSAYVSMTVFMSLTPLAVLGAIGGFVLYRIRKAEQLAETERAQHAAAAATTAPAGASR